MKNYELLYILPSTMTSEEIKNTFLQIEKEILKLKGEKLETLLDHPFLMKTETSKEENSEELKNLPVIKRKLAYPIKKNRFGFYCLFNFRGEEGSIKEIDKYLKMENKVLRHILVQADPMTKEELAKLKKLFARKKAEQDKNEKKKDEDQSSDKKEKEATKTLKITKTKKEDDAVTEKETTTNEKKDINTLKSNKLKEEDSIKTEEELKKTTEEEKVKKKVAPKKKKIKLEDLEDKLDEILEDTII